MFAKLCIFYLSNPTSVDVMSALRYDRQLTVAIPCFVYVHCTSTSTQPSIPPGYVNRVIGLSDRREVRCVHLCWLADDTAVCAFVWHVTLRSSEMGTQEELCVHSRM